MCSLARFAPVVLLLASLAGLVACDSGVKSGGVPELVLSREAFVFPKLAPGETRERLVEVANEGDETLTLTQFAVSDGEGLTLTYALSAAPETYLPFEDERGELPQKLDIPAGEALLFLLSYTAQSATPPEWSLSFITNDADHQEVNLPLRVETSTPELSLSRASVDFGVVAALDTAEESLLLTNAGQAPLVLSALTIENTSKFGMSINGVGVTEASLVDPDGDGTPGIAAGASVNLTLTYSPDSDLGDAAELTIRSNDPDKPTVVVRLSGNGAHPCIQVRPAELHFPGSVLGRPDQRAISIESCGTQPLTVSRITLSEETQDVFDLSINTGSLPFSLPAATPGQSQPGHDITIEFTPAAEVVYNGMLLIESDDPLLPVVEVPLVGRGGGNGCPLAQVARRTFEIEPLDFVELDGSPSVDMDSPDGRPAKYVWTVIGRPEGSTAQPAEDYGDVNDPMNTAIPDDTSTPRAYFFADLAGEYALELTVIDPLGLSAPSTQCPQNPARVFLRAKPRDEIHVQLVWHTPRDADETDDEGADLDLHLRRHGGTWMGEGDCSAYTGRSPDWGAVGQANNPVLDLDDTNGAGPENLTLNDPEVTATIGGPYTIAVHYYRGDQITDDNILRENYWGPSTATVQIFLGGELAGEYSRELNETGNWWVVADLAWAPGAPSLQRVDRTYQQTPP